MPQIVVNFLIILEKVPPFPRGVLIFLNKIEKLATRGGIMLGVVWRNAFSLEWPTSLKLPTSFFSGENRGNGFLQDVPVTLWEYSYRGLGGIVNWDLQRRYEMCLGRTRCRIFAVDKSVAECQIELGVLRFSRSVYFGIRLV